MSDWETNDFTAAVSDLHRAGMLTVKLTHTPLATRIHAEQDDDAEEVIDPLGKSRSHGHQNVTFFWRSAELLDGVDVRAEVQSNAGEGRNLPLTSFQRKLARELERSPLPQGSLEDLLREHGIAPAPAAPVVIRGAERHERHLFASRDLLLRLTNFRAEYKRRSGARNNLSRFVRAEPLLDEHALTRDQVNLWGEGVHITQGGWIQAVEHVTPAYLRKLAEALVTLVSEPLHHSQLRKLAEAFLGTDLDPLDFMNRSLEACGWAGPGYRRPHLPGEPQGRNLHDVARSLLDRRLLRRNEFLQLARRYLRTPPEKLQKVYDEVIQEYWK